MNIAEYSIRHKVISWMFVLLLLVGGSVSFTGLGQLEFPEFTIKEALVITAYPGASPEQVEEEVTLPLEDALQQLDALDPQQMRQALLTLMAGWRPRTSCSHAMRVKPLSSKR